jgi:hypothetical protein
VVVGCGDVVVGAGTVVVVGGGDVVVGPSVVVTGGNVEVDVAPFDVEVVGRVVVFWGTLVVVTGSVVVVAGSVVVELGAVVVVDGAVVVVVHDGIGALVHAPSARSHESFVHGLLSSHSSSHFAEQQSPAVVLPSSHCSSSFRVPSPQVATKRRAAMSNPDAPRSVAHTTRNPESVARATAADVW